MEGSHLTLFLNPRGATWPSVSRASVPFIWIPIPDHVADRRRVHRVATKATRIFDLISLSLSSKFVGGRDSKNRAISSARADARAGNVN